MSESHKFRVMFLGDIVGRPGRKILTERLPELKSEFKPEVVIANGENSAGGFGIQPKVSEEIYKSGVDIITTGDHVWDRREHYEYLNLNKHRMVRPLNFAGDPPGSGSLVWTTARGVKLGVLNALGRVFIEDLTECPFRALERAITSEPLNSCDIVFVDFHAEATSEKVAMGFYLLGKAQAIVGTHTHVQTADARILDGQLAFISDAGMCGPSNGVIGVQSEPIVQRFLTGIKAPFDVAGGPVMINGVVIDFDLNTKKAVAIERLFLNYP